MTCPFNVAIVHYHLRTGGVTRVIEHAVAVLRQRDVPVVVLTGEAPPAHAPLAPVARVVEGLGYDRPDGMAEPGPLARRLTDAAKAALGRMPDLWHFHNPTIGKNGALPIVVAQLAGAGLRLVLQLHDFAEDGRPANYQHLLRTTAAGQSAALDALLYPQADHVHYALLNRRDRDRLVSAGAPADHLTLLANPVDLPEIDEPAGPADRPAGRLFIYPVRGIRRKNLGEFLFWALLGDPDDRFAVTLPATSSTEKPFYDRWKQFVAAVNIPVEFELGLKTDQPFARLLCSADALVSTSVAEGFGLAFLEPWRLGRPLLGRNLPDITADFVMHGLRLDHLYRCVDIPDDWVNPAELDRRLRRALTATRAAYHRPTTADHLDAARHSLRGPRGIDFGRLDESLQQTVLRRLADNPSARRDLSVGDLTDQLDAARSVMDANRTVVDTAFNLESYGQRLYQLYASVLRAEPGPVEALPAAAVLDAFIDPARFNMLRAVHD